MNVRIFRFFIEKLNKSFDLPKYQYLVIEGDSVFQDLPWTPARLNKFMEVIDAEFNMKVKYEGTISKIVDQISDKYFENFFKNGGTWYPRTDEFEYTGWKIVDHINSKNPRAVLDVGCGYNLFKGKINNLVGIDIANKAADYMVDILDFDVPNESYDHVIVFGSINFGQFEDIEVRMKKVIDLTEKGGTIYIRANTGVSHPNGYYIDIYPWSFKDAFNISEKYGCELITLKKDSLDRIYIEMKKK